MVEQIQQKSYSTGEEFPHNIAVVADNSTALGFRLAGLKQVYALDEKAAEQKLAELIDNPDVGIIVMNENYLASIDHRLKKKIDRLAKPVIIAVPDKTGKTAVEAESLKQLVKRALGLELMK